MCVLLQFSFSQSVFVYLSTFLNEANKIETETNSFEHLHFKAVQYLLFVCLLELPGRR